MQIINRVIKKVAAVSAFFNLNDTVQVDLYQAGCPKPVKHHAFVLYPGAEMQQKTHNCRNDEDTETNNQQNIAVAFAVAGKPGIECAGRHRGAPVRLPVARALVPVIGRKIVDPGEVWAGDRAAGVLARGED